MIIETPNIQYDKHGFPIDDPTHDYPFANHSRETYDPNSMVTVGNWVILMKRVPVQVEHRPKTYGIYWAVPHIHYREPDAKTAKNPDAKPQKLVGVDKYGRQCALIYTPEEVKIFPDEYHILDEKKLQEYRNGGWELHETHADVTQPIDLDIIEKGRVLTEEEREVIWSLMLDGLSEQQACEEYFLCKHSDYNNTAICYLPPEEVRQELIELFGE